MLRPAHRTGPDPATADPDAGFTLVELLISITLMGIVLTTVVAVSFVAVHNAAAADSRLDDSNDLVRAAAYFGDDVAGAQGVAVDSEPLCGTDDAALVEFSGQDFTDSNPPALATTVVTYVVRQPDDEDQPPELHRLSCRADSTAPAYPLTPLTDVTVVRGLSDDVPAVSCGGAACGPGFAQVDLTVTESGGLSFTLTGRRRTSP